MKEICGLKLLRPKGHILDTRGAPPPYIGLDISYANHII